MRKRLTAALAASVLAAGGLVGVSAPSAAAAVTCLSETNRDFDIKPDGLLTHPPAGVDRYLKTGKYCNDINLKMTTSSRYVKVCWFSKADYEPLNCQANYTWAPKGSWKVIASDVSDGQPYKLRFETSSKANFFYAD